jgi:5-methylcytosine-specific restriction endonuclease McrA
MKMYKCKICDTETKWSYQKSNIYCSVKCAGAGAFVKTLERHMLGEVSDRDTLRKIMKETKGYKCACCGISEYMEKPLTLQVDHMNGDASNNMPDNLRLICPNCHSQTDTYGAKNKGNGRRARGLSLK